MGEQQRVRRQQITVPVPMPAARPPRDPARDVAPRDPVVAPETQQPVGHDFTRIPVLGPQAKLAVSQPGDPAEREADRVAEAVLRDDGAAAPAAIGAGSGRQGGLARSAAPTSEPATGVAPPVHDTGLGAGTPLASEVRAALEPRFGHDFGQVRVHTDDRAAASARMMQAHAYTLGPDIVFGAGQYAPETGAGQRLLAHELTHVVQQTGGAPLGAGKAPGAAIERHTAAIQRQAFPQPLPEWGDGGDSSITFNVHAELVINDVPQGGAWFIGGKTIDQFKDLPRDCTGRMRIFNDVFYYYHEKHWYGDDKRSGQQQTSTTDVAFKIEKGKLSFLTPAEPSGGGGVPGLFTLDVSTSPATASGDGASGVLGLKTHFKADATQPGKQVTVSGTGGIEAGMEGGGLSGKASRGAGGQVQTSGLTTTGAGQRDGSFLINLHVKPTDKLSANAPTVMFQTGKTKMTRDYQDDLIRWWDGLAVTNPDLQNNIRSGATKIRLTGYASTLGDDPATLTNPDAKPRVDNFKLSEERNAAVKALLLRIIGGLEEKSIVADPKGSAVSKNYGTDMDAYAQEQRVDISVQWEQ